MYLMGVPNRQAAQRGWVYRKYPLGYTVSLLVRLIFDSLPKPRLFQKGHEYPSPTFSEGPGTPNRELTSSTACRESSHSISANSRPLLFTSHSEKTIHSTFNLKKGNIVKIQTTKVRTATQTPLVIKNKVKTNTKVQ